MKVTITIHGLASPINPTNRYYIEHFKKALAKLIEHYPVKNWTMEVESE